MEENTGTQFSVPSLLFALVDGNRVSHLQTLKISEKVLDRCRMTYVNADKPKDDDDGDDDEGLVVCCARSIFGYFVIECVYDTKSVFEGWKQWKMVSKIYYRTMPPDDGGDGERFGTIDPSVLGKNVNGPCEYSDMF